MDAAELAARINIPRRLPVRHDGEPLRHLSHASYSRFLLCPDDWRRHYLLGERTPPSGHMFLGARVDDALSTYHRHLLACGERLSLDQLHDAYRDHWTDELAAEEADRGVHWDAELDEPRAFTMGLEALALTLRELLPVLGRPVAVQRELSYALAPGLEWTIQGFLDLETLRPSDDRGGELVPAIVDYKDDEYRVRRHPSLGRRAARDAGADRAGREPDSRALRTLRPRRALGLCRSQRLEVLGPLLRALRSLSGRRRAVNPSSPSASIFDVVRADALTA